jgi:hypothetical protein
MRTFAPAIGVAAITLLLSCRSVPPSPPLCDADPPSLACWYRPEAELCGGRANRFDEASRVFWFSRALIHPDYHYWSIAPEEMVNPATRTGLLATRLSVVPDRACRARTERALRKVRNKPAFTALRITGRGRWHPTELRIIVDCVCEAEPVTVPESAWSYLWAI